MSRVAHEWYLKEAEHREMGAGCLFKVALATFAQPLRLLAMLPSSGSQTIFFKREMSAAPSFWVTSD